MMIKSAASILLLMRGSIGGNLIALLFLPLSTRIFCAEQMGLGALFLSFFGVANYATCLHYEVAIVSTPNPRAARELLLGCIWIAGPIGILISLLFFFVIQLNFLGFGRLPTASPLLLLFLLWITAAQLCLRYYSIKLAEFRCVSNMTFLQSSSRGLIQVIYGLAFIPNWIGLVAGELLGRILAVGVALRQLRATWKKYPTPSYRRVLSQFRRYRRFAFYGLPAVWVDALALTLPIPLITSIYSAEMSGHFALAQKVWMVPVYILGTSVADVFHSHISSTASEDLEPLFWKTARQLALVAVLPALCIYFFGARLSRLVFGEDWVQAGNVLEALVPWYFSQLVVSPLSRLAEVLQGQRSLFIFFSCVCIANIGIFTIAKSEALGFLPVIHFLSVSMGLMNGAYFLVLWWMLRNNKTQVKTCVELPA